MHVTKSSNKFITLLVGILLCSCSGQKKAHESNTEKIETSMQKLENGAINPTAQLECSGSTIIHELIISGKKYATDDFECSISNENGLTIKLSSLSKGMEILVQIIGSSKEFGYNLGEYPCLSVNDQMFSKVFINSKELGKHHFGDNFEGSTALIDYGMSSNIICGAISVKGPKENIIKANFNETIH